MNVLSLFDGMSCGQISLNRAGLKVDNYYASELDKYAITVTQANHPDTIQLGDVNNWREWDIDWASIDLLIGGSPCQGFSFAGKQLAFDDPRSKLFFVYVDILNHIKSLNPDVKFLLENVRMKKEYLDIISEHLDVEPVFINSALVSAQSRQRFYWANWHFEQPEDKGILLKDIIENDFVDRDKSHCIDANYFKGGNLKSYFEKNRRQLVFCGAMRGRYLIDGKRQDGKMKTAGLTEQRFEIRRDEKTNTLTTVQKDNYAVFMKQLARGYNKGFNRLTDKTPPLTSSSREHNHSVSNDEITYRKLTPIECERLQTVDDNYTNYVSNTQRYKMLGNGWTVDVIAHIFKGLSL